MDYVDGNGDLRLVSESDTEVERGPEYWATRLTAAWVAACPIRPPDVDIRKNAKVALRVCESREPQDIGMALRGINHLPPFCMGVMWDVFDLERLFAKAMQMGVIAPADMKAAREKNTLLEHLRRHDDNGDVRQIPPRKR